MTTTLPHFPTRILAAALALGAIFDQLFYGRLPGLSVLLFVSAVLLALTGLGRSESVAPVRRNLWLVVPLLFFAAMVAVRANGFLIALNILACLLLLALLAYFYAAGRLDRIGVFGYYLSLLLSSVNALFRAAPLLPAGIEVSRLNRKNVGRALPVLRGLLLALPVAIVFLVLLASADMVFERYLGALFNLQFLPDMRETMLRTALALFVAWIMAGGLAFALSRRDAGEDEPWESALQTVPTIIRIGFVESTVILTVINLIFLLFGWIQLSYLFGGQANIAAEGLTYAEYARRGFFELLAVSLLTLGLILGLHHFTWRETQAQSFAFRLLATLMVGLTGVLLASAFLRMMLYEEAYGYTHLRLYVHVFEAWLAMVFVWTLVTLWIQPRRFAIGAFAAAIGFLVTLNLINPDAMIAEQNLARYASSGSIDVYYLDDLSDDATPTLLRGIDTLESGDRDYLLFKLKIRFQHMQSDSNWRGLPSLNLARLQAYNALTQEQTRLLKAEFPATTPSHDTQSKRDVFEP
jgi:hypothetical protein